ncbi:hypothetical protein O181_000323 [Austropuccinia psidii MF-1]|uniref:Uncharacterized protein n=1 Tax=Austropuccinia psidii MF-1 TaxID=1389203 RepID=A0A9Q3B8C9_9BASI|nr:hypothetical protein [Austropuccinia psidii MF-1]
MSLKAQTHLNAIHNVWVIMPHGARQQVGMLIFVHEKTCAPPPDHLTPLPCLLSLELASASPPNPLQPLACLGAHTALQM